MQLTTDDSGEIFGTILQKKEHELLNSFILNFLFMEMEDRALECTVGVDLPIAAVFRFSISK
jgi:hypothetical protein